MNARRVGSQFVGKVANAVEILMVKKKRSNDSGLPTARLELQQIRSDDKASVVVQQLVNYLLPILTEILRLPSISRRQLAQIV